MYMSNITRYERDGIELAIDTETGEAFATQTGYARMSGLSQQAVNKRCQGYNAAELKTTEIQTAGGFQPCNLIPAKLAFKWMIKDNPELAEKMGECGATVFLHQIAGYQIASNATPPKPQPTVRSRDEAMKAAATISKLVSDLKSAGLDLSDPTVESGCQEVILGILQGSQDPTQKSQSKPRKRTNLRVVPAPVEIDIPTLLTKIWDKAIAQPEGFTTRDAYRALPLIQTLAKQSDRPIQAVTTELFFELEAMGKGRVVKDKRVIKLVAISN